MADVWPIFAPHGFLSNRVGIGPFSQLGLTSVLQGQCSTPSEQAHTDEAMPADRDWFYVEKTN